MNKLRCIVLTAFSAVVCMLVSGCYTPTLADGKAARFHEGDSVNVVLRFYQWDSVCILKPAYRDQGYLRYVRSDNLDGAFKDLSVSRDTAVVLMGWNYNSQEMAVNVEHWKSILVSHGFRRVVCLRDNDVEKLDGLPVISDWQRPSGQPRQTAGL